MVFPMQMEDLSQFAILYDAFCGPRENRGPKRRLEELLDYDLDFNVFNNALRSETFRPDVKRARNNYIPKELSLPYAQFGMTLLDTGPSLEIPAFGKDGTEEVAGKFDLIINSLTSLYNRESAPLEPNHLLFHFQGLNSIPYALGENNPACDPLKALIQIQVYEECEKVPLDDGVFHSCNDLEKEMRLTTNVQESYSLRFGHMNMDPLATLVSFKELRKHIKSSNEILRSQYASLLRNQSYISLKDKVVEQHGPNSVVALIVHMRSPEVFLNTFVPQGVLSSKTTGKHIEEPYQGKVTLQTQGLLNIDIEDGDQHLQQGSMLSSAYLYLIIEMNHKDTFVTESYIQLLLAEYDRAKELCSLYNHIDHLVSKTLSDSKLPYNTEAIFCFYFQGHEVLLQFLALDKDQELFSTWLRIMCTANSKQQ